MRKYLVQKKQSIAGKVSKENSEADRDAIEEEKLAAMIKKIKEKAELLVAMRPPKSFKAKETLDFAKPLIPKMPSYFVGA